MASAQELVQAVQQARSGLESQLGQCSDKWEVKPQGGEGEDAWCQKEVAQHVIGADWFFTNGIAQACGAPALDRPNIDVATPEAALQSLRTIGAADDKILSKVQDGDLAKTFELRGLGNQSVESMLQIMASHAQDHANQIRAAGA